MSAPDIEMQDVDEAGPSRRLVWLESFGLIVECNSGAGLSSQLKMPEVMEGNRAMPERRAANGPSGFEKIDLVTYDTIKVGFSE